MEAPSSALEATMRPGVHQLIYPENSDYIYLKNRKQTNNLSTIHWIDGYWPWGYGELYKETACNIADFSGLVMTTALL